MERTQKSRFSGFLLCLHCVIPWQTTHIYIKLQDIYKCSSQNVHSALTVQWNKLNHDNIEQERRFKNTKVKFKNKLWKQRKNKRDL